MRILMNGKTPGTMIGMRLLDPNGKPTEVQTMQKIVKTGKARGVATLEKATFAAGCFWHVEETFRELQGIVATQVGYIGGTRPDPTYEDVCSDETGHAEAVEVTYDASQLSYDQLLDIFWKNHDPTTPDRQGPDEGTQYRSAIFYHTPAQKEAAIASQKQLEKSGRYRNPIVTQIVPADTFWRAEDYHQQYLKKKGLKSCRIM